MQTAMADARSKAKVRDAESPLINIHRAATPSNEITTTKRSQPSPTLYRDCCANINIESDDNGSDAGRCANTELLKNTGNNAL